MMGWIVLNMITSGVRVIALRLRHAIVIASETAHASSERRSTVGVMAGAVTAAIS